MDWPVDDQPIWMRTRSGPILTVPYPIEINDSPALVFRQQPAASSPRWSSTSSTRCWTSRTSARWSSASAAPFIIGQPFRLRAFRRAMDHIMARRDELWITTPGEIARYCETLPPGTLPGS